MSTRGVYTPRVPAAGGDDSTPAPIQVYVLSSTPVPSTAANVENLTIFEVVARQGRPLEAGSVKSGNAPRRRLVTPLRCARAACALYRATLRHGGCARAHRPRSIATPQVCTCAPTAQHCDTAGVHVHSTAQHCDTARVLVRTEHVALRHGRCARAHPRSKLLRVLRVCVRHN